MSQVADFSCGHCSEGTVVDGTCRNCGASGFAGPTCSSPHGVNGHWAFGSFAVAVRDEIGMICGMCDRTFVKRETAWHEVEDAKGIR